MANREDLQAKFELFHSRKPWIYDRFCETCEMLIQRGLTHASATMVLEYVKIDHAIRSGEHVAIPNDYRGYYAKKWLASHKTPWRFLRMSPREAKVRQLAIARDLVRTN
jgi:hypothetical protein